LVTSSEEGNETDRRAPRNLHYDLFVTLKGGKKERQDEQCEDQD
jgi:hypothetical protein